MTTEITHHLFVLDGMGNLAADLADLPSFFDVYQRWERKITRRAQRAGFPRAYGGRARDDDELETWERDGRRAVQAAWDRRRLERATRASGVTDLVQRRRM
ncbi:MAG TPA: hypothetical protein VME63_02335 [Dyella sp.]|uniref:hypothetical protein n=1 Tax=Dyella sp. TaxID=1869338 RepID=UPI002BA5AD6F|nr:hypothetical protein [Dyella sp.]HTV84212.1 hypothetical protein [Dyella sp.]